MQCEECELMFSFILLNVYYTEKAIKKTQFLKFPKLKKSELFFFIVTLSRCFSIVFFNQFIYLFIHDLCF